MAMARSRTSPEATVCRGDRVGAGTCFLDIDGDSDLDLFAANYVQFSLTSHRAPKQLGRSRLPRPAGLPAEETNFAVPQRGRRPIDRRERSFRHRREDRHGDGHRLPATSMPTETRTSVSPTTKWPISSTRTMERERLTEAGMFSGVAYDGMGMARGSMGADCGDFDNDGQLDLYVTAYQYERATLYRNLGSGLFQDVTRLTGAGSGTAAST